MNVDNEPLLYVNCNRVMRPGFPADHCVGEFSCHWAAVAALIRTTSPDFRSMGGDSAEDLAEEGRMASALEAA